MSDKLLSRERYGEAFWRTHHEAWRHSELNQREIARLRGFPLKAFGNWRAKFKAEPQPPSPKQLYRRRGLSHTLGHSLSQRLSHMTYGSPVSGPIVPPVREGHRRRFNEADKRQILEEAVQAGANLSEVARRYGIAARVLFRWKQELPRRRAVHYLLSDKKTPADAFMAKFGGEIRSAGKGKFLFAVLWRPHGAQISMSLQTGIICGQ
jgi:hypothetical protein